MAPTVALDVTACMVGSTGVGRYTNGVWSELIRRGDVSLKPFALGRGHGLPQSVRRIPVPLRVAHAAWSASRWPSAEQFVGPFDLLHALDLLPAPTRAPVALSIQDVFVISHPALCSPRARSIQLRQLRAARDSQVIMTISRATADVIADAVDVPRDRVIATGMGPLAVGEVAPASGEYLLAVGAITPRKAFEQLAAAVNDLPDSPPLRIAGPDGWAADETRRLVREADRKGKVTLLGNVSDAELAGLYRGARALCQASLAEGFGMACLDAMTYGCPIAATDLPSTRELVGDAAVLFPPGDTEAMAAGIEAVLADSERAAARAMQARVRAEPYTWAAAGDRVVEAYQLALGRSAPEAHRAAASA